MGRFCLKYFWTGFLHCYQILVWTSKHCFMVYAISRVHADCGSFIMACVRMFHCQTGHSVWEMCQDQSLLASLHTSAQYQIQWNSGSDFSYSEFPILVFFFFLVVCISVCACMLLWMYRSMQVPVYLCAYEGQKSTFSGIPQKWSKLTTIPNARKEKFY